MRYPVKIDASIAVGDKTSSLVEFLDFDRGVVELPASTKKFSLQGANSTDGTPVPFHNYHDATATPWAVGGTVAKAVDIPESALAFRYLQVASDTTATAAALSCYMHVAKSGQ